MVRSGWRKLAHRRTEINAYRQQLKAWYASHAGQLLAAGEKQQLDEVLNDLFGYHIVQVGTLFSDDLLDGSRIRHQVVLDPDPADRRTVGLYAYPDALPLETDSIDVIVLPHTLEFDREPHQLLREVDRVLIPEGHAVVLGFNPWSLWGLWRLFLMRRDRAPWCGNFLSQSRLKDWFGLLGFDVVLLRGHFYRPPLQRPGLMRRLGFMERLGGRYWPAFCGGYVLVARKRVTMLTPLKPRWRPRRSMVGKLAGPVRSCERG